MTVLAFTQLRTPAGGVVASIADTRAGHHAVRPLGRCDRQLGRGHRTSHLRLGYAWSGRVLRRHGAAATVLRPVVTGEFDAVADHSGGGRHPVQTILLPWASIMLLEGLPFDRSAARGRSRLNLPTEFVARVGSRFK